MMNRQHPFNEVVLMRPPVHVEKPTSTMKVMAATGNPARPL